MRNLFQSKQEDEPKNGNVSIISYKENGNRHHQVHLPTKEDFVPEYVPRLEPATFEQAISATGFGRFNYILMLAAFPSALATSFDSTTLSFVIPKAHCDLELTPFKKGALNAVTYFGMICSAFLWGFLADTLGRKKLLVIGYSLASCFDFLCMFSVNYWMLLVLKYLNGFSICGPFALLMSYVSEMHSAKNRAKIVMFSGICFSSTNILLPCIAWIILPRDIEFSLFNGFYNFYSWKLFLGVCAIPSALSATGMSLMPESPKFLMTMGKNDEALDIFKMIYSRNTGKSPDSFPIKELVDERAAVGAPIVFIIGAKRISTESQVAIKRPFCSKVYDGWKQIRPLFAPPYVQRVVLVFVIQMLGMMGVNTLRLWMPQIFTVIETYKHNHTETASLCTMMEESPMIVGDNSTIGGDPSVCEEVEMDSQIFINYIILGAIQGILYMFAGPGINFLGKKRLLVTLFLCSGVIGCCLYLAQDSITTLILSSLFCAFSSICVTTVISVSVDLVPTSLRTMTVSLLMMCGRIGALTGNLIFPLLLAVGCLPPFLLIGIGTICCGLFSFLLPKTDRKPLM